MRIAYGSSALYERLATSGTDPCSGTTRLRPSSADTVTLLFIIGSDLCLVVSRIAGLTVWVRDCLSLMTSLVPRNCYRGGLIPRKKTLVTSVTDQQTGSHLVKRFSMFNDVLDAGASPEVTRTLCDLRLTSPRKARYGKPRSSLAVAARRYFRIFLEKRKLDARTHMHKDLA